MEKEGGGACCKLQIAMSNIVKTHPCHMSLMYYLPVWNLRNGIIVDFWGPDTKYRPLDLFTLALYYLKHVPPCILKE